MFSGSIVALVTPMGVNGSIDEPAWQRLIDWYLASGTDGVVVGGTTGESATLLESEFSRLLELTVDRAAGRMSILAGTGTSSTAETIRRSQLAGTLGADAALVVTPAYNRPTQRGLEAHFNAVADASPVPVVLYNVPARTACDLLPETTIRLIEHANIVAIKEAVGDSSRVGALLEAGVVVLSGDDPTCCERILDGAAGVISVAANVAPAIMAGMCRLAADKEAGKARQMNAELLDLYAFLGVEPNPVPVKWLLHRMGWIESGIRLPLVTLDERYRTQADDLINALELDVARELA